MSRTRKDNRGMIVPVFAVLLGFVWLAVGVAAGDTVAGIGAMLIMFIYAGVLLALGKRNEPVRLLRGNPQDERQAGLLMKAQASTQLTVAPVLVVGTLWSVATDASSASVWLGLTAFNGLCQFVFTFYYSRHA